MQSVVVVCSLRDMVIEKFDISIWELVLEKSGLPKDTVFLPTESAPDELVFEVANNLCNVLGTTICQATDAFGEYWMNSYVSKVCNTLHIRALNSREFLLKLNDIHSKVCKAIKGTNTPYFKFDWKDENTLIMTCESMSQMPFCTGLVKGVGKYFKERLEVDTWSSNQILIRFPQFKDGRVLE